MASEAKLNKSLDDIIKENAKASKSAPRRGKAPGGRVNAQAKQAPGAKGGVGKRRPALDTSAQPAKPGNRQRGAGAVRQRAAPAAGRRQAAPGRQAGPRAEAIRVTITNQTAMPAQQRMPMPVGFVTAALPSQLPQQRQAQRSSYQAAAYVPQSAAAQAQMQAYQAQQARAQMAFLRDDAERGEVLATTNANGMRMDQYGYSAARPRFGTVQ